MRLVLPVVSAMLLTACSGLQPQQTARQTAAQTVDLRTLEAEVNRTLDAFHAAKVRNDEDAYFRCFTPDAIMLGSDPNERWTIPQLREFAHPYFEAKMAWTYTLKERHVHVHPSGTTAWYDETVENALIGTCRGQGVLVRHDGEWKIAQAGVAMLIPGEVSEDVAALIRGQPQREPRTPSR
jgi:hypothetical protein